MKLRDMIARGRLISLVCSECHATVELDPTPFAGRFGDNTTLDQLKSDLVCPQCDSYDIRLRAVRREPRPVTHAQTHTQTHATARPELPAWMAPPAPMRPDDYWRRAAHATRLPPVPPH